MTRCNTTRGRRPNPQRIYTLASECQACTRPILPGQIWKFTPDGGKVHYHCAQNPTSTDYDWSSEEAMRHLDSLTDAQLRRRLDIVRSQITVTYDRHKWASRGRAGGTSSQQDALRALENLQDQEGAIALARLRKFDRGYGSRNPTGPTFSQAMTMARAAGAKIGDTSGFEPWLVQAKLDSRGPKVRAKLEREFWAGVEGGDAPVKKTATAITDYGVRRDAQGMLRTALAPGKTFSTLKEVMAFVESGQQNPANDAPRYVPAEDDWPIGPIRWTVIDTHDGAKVRFETRSKRNWARFKTRQQAERAADKLNRQLVSQRRPHAA